MGPFRAPAVAPALAFALGIGLTRAAAAPPPVGALALLAALGVALGGRGSRLLVSSALGALCALTAPAPLLPDPDRVAEIVGRAGPPARRDSGSTSVPLIAERLTQGGRTRGGRLELRLELAPGLEPPAAGARVRARGSIGRAAGFANERRVRPGGWRLRVKSSAFVETLEAPGWLRRGVEGWRKRARRPFERAERAAPRPGLRVARALLLGESEALGPEWRRALRRTGLGHLVAVSGFHVTLVALLAALLCAPAGRVAGRVGTALAVLGYLALVGAGASVLRAAAMSLLALAGLAAGRAPEALQGLALALIALLAQAPERISEVGFQLSFAATAGLLTLAPGGAERLAGRGLPRPLALGLAATLAAQAASLPFAVAAFGELSPAAPLFNLLATPWAAAVLAASLGWLGVAALWPAAGDLLAAALDPAALPLAALAALPPSPLLSVAWPGGWTAGLWVSLLLGAAVAGRGARRAALLAALGLVQTGHGPAAQAPFELLAFDVGQGDALLLRRGAVALLFDGGGPPGAPVGLRVLRPALADRGLYRLTAAIVSHPDLDHCSGLVELAAELRIDEVWAPAGAAATPCVAALLEATGRPLTALVAGDRLERGGFEFEILHPPRERGGGTGNSSSLVAAVEAGGRRLLLTADIGAGEERSLVLARRDALAADLLKIPHHGSAGSSSTPFLVAARPRLAIVSAGWRNGYGHPARAALGRIRSRGLPLLRTDRDGGVVVRWRQGEPWRIGLPGSPPPRQ